MKKETTKWLLIIGIVIIALAEIIFHYINLPDLAKGSIVGVGLGLSLLSFILKKIKAV